MSCIFFSIIFCNDNSACNIKWLNKSLSGIWRQSIFIQENDKVILLQQEHLNAFPTKNDKGFQTVILFCYFRIAETIVNYNFTIKINRHEDCSS